MTTDSGCWTRLCQTLTMRKLALIVIAVAGWLIVALPAAAEELPPGGSFIDDDGRYYEPSIEAIFDANITVGCSDRDEYCPERDVTREEMAAFLARALNLSPTEEDFFGDDNDSPLESAINRIAAAKITTGCNPPDNDAFCPERRVTREEMATFLVRAFSVQDPDVWDVFVDDDESVHEANIDRIAGESITVGCNPPDNDRFCPDRPLIRAEMASFFARALDL